jgi:HD-like signal output (HDOD) protein
VGVRVGIRSDLILIERAVRKRWNFDRSLAERAVEDGLRSDDPRVKMRALAVAVAMEKQNQSDEHKVLDLGNQRKDDQLAAIAAELGLDPRIVLDAERVASGDAEGTEEHQEADDPTGERSGEGEA